MKNLALYCIVITFSTISLLFFWKTIMKNKHTGTVIILNGPSAAGKSSIQREFQFLMMNEKNSASNDQILWIKLGIDNLFDKPMPDITAENIAYWQTQNPIRWVTATQDSHQNQIITLYTGNQGDQVAYGMNSAIVAYAQAGCNIIVDYIAYKKEWVDDLRNKLKDTKNFWVKVTIPLEIIEQREAARGTSPKGHARSHYDYVHWDIKYQLAVDSAKDSPATIAKKIKDSLHI